MKKSFFFKPPSCPVLTLAFLAIGFWLKLAFCSAQYLVDSPAPLAKGWTIKVLAEGVVHPWGLAWLPNGEMLITSRAGTLHLLKEGHLQEIPIKGLPKLFAEGQGGLLDISVHPRSRAGAGVLIYMTLSTGEEAQNRTVLVRGIFDGKQVISIRTLFQAEPDKNGAEHFGSRLVWLPDCTLLMSIGDGGNPPRTIDGMLARDQAQNLGSHLGSIVRLDEDGKVPPGQPFAESPGAKAAIWSFGHRNIQGLTRDPLSGRVWATEHGPLGGDELNLILAGKNYGWPKATYGRDYRTTQAIGSRHVAATERPKVVWLPMSVAPSGLTVYRGSHFPAWRGNLFSGNLVGFDVHRIIVDDKAQCTGVERLPIGARVRDVRMGPDGYLYLLTDEAQGKVLRIEPKP